MNTPNILAPFAERMKATYAWARRAAGYDSTPEKAEKELLKDMEAARWVKEARRTHGVKLMEEFGKIRREEIQNTLLYDTTMKPETRIFLQGELVGLETFTRHIERTIALGDLAEKQLEELRKEENAAHGQGR